MKDKESDDLKPEYDFSKGVRGKYARRFAEGVTVNYMGCNCGSEHRTVGHRAWCYSCGEWCYPTFPCLREHAKELEQALSWALDHLPENGDEQFVEARAHAQRILSR